MTIETTCPYIKEGMTEEEVVAFFDNYHQEVTDEILAKSLAVLKGTLRRLDQAVPCRQYQLALDDIESAESHLRELIAVGPRERLREKPLEESQIEEDFSFESAEIEYAQGDEEILSVQEDSQEPKFI